MSGFFVVVVFFLVLFCTRTCTSDFLTALFYPYMESNRYHLFSVRVDQEILIMTGYSSVPIVPDLGTSGGVTVRKLD